MTAQAATPPKKAPKLVTRKSANSVEVFERVDDGRFVGYALTKGVVDEKDQPLTLSWVGAKIPLTEWHKFLAFAQFIFERDNSECQANLMYDMIDNKWVIWAFPQEGQTGMTAKEIENEEAQRQRAQFFPAVELDANGRTLKGPDGKPVRRWTCLGSVHTHCSASAFQSGTDEANERNRDGLHITIGKMRDASYDLHVRMYYRGLAYTNPPLASWFDCDAIVERADSAMRALGFSLTADQRKAIITSELAKKAPADTTYPQQWVDNVVITVNPRVPAAYGGMQGGNASDYASYQHAGSGFHTKTYGAPEWKVRAVLEELVKIKKLSPEDIQDVVEFFEKNEVGFAMARGFSRVSFITPDEYEKVLDALQELQVKLWEREVAASDDERDLARENRQEMMNYLGE